MAKIPLLPKSDSARKIGGRGMTGFMLENHSGDFFPTSSENWCGPSKPHLFPRIAFGNAFKLCSQCCLLSISAREKGGFGFKHLTWEMSTLIPTICWKCRLSQHLVVFQIAQRSIWKGQRQKDLASSMNLSDPGNNARGVAVLVGHCHKIN